MSWFMTIFSTITLSLDVCTVHTNRYKLTNDPLRVPTCPPAQKPCHAADRPDTHGFVRIVMRLCGWRMGMHCIM